MENVPGECASQGRLGGGLIESGGVETDELLEHVVESFILHSQGREVGGASARVGGTGRGREPVQKGTYLELRGAPEPPIRAKQTGRQGRGPT